MPVDRPVELGPIDSAEVDRVAGFLEANLPSHVSAATWRRAMTTTWVDAPNHGFRLSHNGAIVGAYLAFYSRRDVGGQEEKICNLGAWCVLEEYRSHGLQLIRAMLRQRGYTFTDLSPSGNVVELNKRLRFVELDTTTAAMANLPWPPRSQVRVTSDPAVIAANLSERDMAIYRDHAASLACRHVLIRSGDHRCYVMFRHDRRKRIPGFASILYVSDPSVFLRSHRHLCRHLLLRHRVLVTLAELRVVGGRPNGAVTLRKARPKMFKSDHLSSDQVDYLYSELTNVAW